MSNKFAFFTSTHNTSIHNQRHYRTPKRLQGFSLIELLTTLAVISILMFIGVPSIVKMTSNSQLQTATQDLLTAIQTTRTLAVMQHKRAVLRAKNEWHHGWELFIDNNDNGIRDKKEELIFEQSGLNQITISTTNKSMKIISFVATGESRQAKGSRGGAFLAGTLNICKGTGSGYKLILARGGRTRVSKTNCS
jgi:type IV fimbrial biogenesis protein FimT